MIAFLKSRAEARDKERRALVAGLTTLLCQKWQLKADELEANTAEPSSIEERFEAALRKNKETKPKETGADADAKEERRPPSPACSHIVLPLFIPHLHIFNIFRIPNLTSQTNTQGIKATSTCKPPISSARSIPLVLDISGRAQVMLRLLTDRRSQSTYISISAVPRLAANTQFAQRTFKPTGSLQNFNLCQPNDLLRSGAMCLWQNASPPCLRAQA
ncbi:hypothetical protein FPANT_8182 [Fusarium pseudoanthophilum]|uniref:Uncharacterized protein n=1 Tax=Fusarium pseudoanthophilum TaxID=48495 RepID=A0A8H5L312_9HYPO|nr:hypothetical protein FPANT_8182 [Fusarium pseudoanthophilum]